MATVQVQTTRLAPTTTKTEITQKQSLEVVQTFLHGSLSSLAYLRNFFSEKAFDDQIYTTGSRMPTYREYANGTLPLQNKNPASMETNMKVLRRERSRRADQFLDWLVRSVSRLTCMILADARQEKGAFAALQKGRLSALQIYVHTDPEHREKVVETYTFAIKYHNDGRGGRVFAGLEVDSPGREGFTVEATSLALQSLIRHVNQLCDGLPDLPEKRYVSMALFYPEDCEEFKATGFEPASLSEILFAQADGWEKYTERLNDIQSAFHSTSLKVSHLDQPAHCGLPHVVEYPRLPSRLTYTMDQTREAEIAEMLGFQLGDNATAERSPSTIYSEGVATAECTPSTVFLDDDRTTSAAAEITIATPAPTAAQVEGLLPSGSPPLLQESPRQPSLFVNTMLPDTVGTQSGDVPEMKAGLQGMLKPEHLSQGDTQTQALLRPPIVDASGFEQSNPSAPLSASSTTSSKLLLLPNVAHQLESTKAKLKEKALRIVNAGPSKRKLGQVVLCQCGHAEKENDMIECSLCDTWQHLNCYGFTGEADPRLPDYHVCYECLLGSHDASTLAVLSRLTLKRRTMSLALHRGLPSRPEQLAKLMDVSTQAADTLLADLVKEGFVIHAPGARRSKSDGTKNPYYVSAQEERSLEMLQHSLFDALSHINGYYANIPSIPEIIGRQLRAIQSTSMPPPATPASQLRNRNRNASQLPLGSRRSATPSRRPQLRKSSSKRPPEEQNIFATPAKRQARTTPVYHRLKSVQTMVPIFVDGLSSPAN
ncbi:Meiosis-specific protein hop1 [Cercospora zeina]